MAKNSDVLVNDDLRSFKNINLIGNDGTNYGNMTYSEASKLAKEKGLDMLLVSKSGDNSRCVAKLLDYGRHKYEQSKKERENKKNQTIIEVKEVQLSIKCADNDLHHKARNGARFISDGNKIKVALRFEGREMAHRDLAAQQIERYFSILKDMLKGSNSPSLADQVVLAPISAEGRNTVISFISLGGSSNG